MIDAWLSVKDKLFPPNDDIFGDADYLYTGSSVICDPPVTDTDRDIVIVFSSRANNLLREHGFTASDAVGSDKYPNSSVNMCYRKGNINIIAVADNKAMQDWKKATNLARVMNLRDKQQRVILFQFITEKCTRETGIEY